MLLNKEILIGLFGGARKNIEFNLSWNTNITQITAYPPSQNENDRPRINTWRSDGTNVVYMSAGSGNQKLSSTNFFQPSPWGNRQTGNEKINITVSGSLTAGVDVFTDSFLLPPTLSPATGWKTITTFSPPVPGQVQYQYTVTRASSAIQNISVTFNNPTGAQLSGFSVTTTSGNILVDWGDQTSQSLNSNTAVNHTFYCSDYSASPSTFWNNINPCL